MKLSRIKLQKLIKEEIKKLNEEFDFDYNDEIGGVFKILYDNLPEPYTVEIVGKEIIVYGIDASGDVDRMSIEFKVVFP